MKIDSSYNPIYNLNANLSSSFDRTAGLEEKMREAAEKLDFPQIQQLINQGADPNLRVETNTSIVLGLFWRLHEGYSELELREVFMGAISEFLGLVEDRGEYRDDNFLGVNTDFWDFVDSSAGTELIEQCQKIYDSSMTSNRITGSFSKLKAVFEEVAQLLLSSRLDEMVEDGEFPKDITLLQLTTLLKEYDLARCLVSQGINWNEQRFTEPSDDAGMILPEEFLFIVEDLEEVLDLMELFISDGCPFEYLVRLDEDFHYELCYMNLADSMRIIDFIDKNYDLKSFLLEEYEDGMSYLEGLEEVANVWYAPENAKALYRKFEQIAKGGSEE